MAHAIEPGIFLARDARHSWLDHPVVAEHYRRRGLIDGVSWEEWVTRYLGEPPGRSLELGCGPGTRSLYLFEKRLAQVIDGIGASEDEVAAAERSRQRCGAPGVFRVADLNSHVLPTKRYDLVFACHQLQHVVALEHVLDQVYAALTPRGLFVLEGYVGPSRFQWTDAQIELVKMALSWLPERLRVLREGASKTHEGRPEPTAVARLSPFSAIRSSDIVPLVERRFHTTVFNPLGGTLQQLLYNGIIHNFAETDPEAGRHLEAACQLEDVLIDTGLLPSDFVLMIGRRR